MTLVEVVELSSDDDDEVGELGVKKAVKLEADLDVETHQIIVSSKPNSTRQENKEEDNNNGSLHASNTGNSNSSIILDQGQSPVEDTGLSSTLSMSPAPVCRQFWKAGNYDDGLTSKVTHQSMKWTACFTFIQ